MRRRIILIIITVIVAVGAVIAWWLFNRQSPASQESLPQKQASEAVTIVTGECALDEGAPTYTYNISELAVVDATYEIFDDTKAGQRGLLPGGESFFWTTLDPEIVITINDGEPQTVTATSCDATKDSSTINLKTESDFSEMGVLG